MFTGIIESFAILKAKKTQEKNLELCFSCVFLEDLKIDQSLAHHGICLTVTELKNDFYKVVAIEETIEKTNIRFWEIGDKINLERAMKMGSRLDGHIVQGHVDQTGICTNIEHKKGSWIFSFEYAPNFKNITIEKGSITINGTSLTVLHSQKNSFSVAIIPYTYEHTNFHLLKKGSIVNLEFDVIGKYVAKIGEYYF